MQKLLERHPLPWTCDEKMVSDHYFVRDAKGQTVVLVGAMDETRRTEGLESGGMSDGLAFIVEKRPRPGALQLARMIAALPDLMAAITDAHAHVSNDRYTDRSNSGLDGRLEALIERLAS